MSIVALWLPILVSAVSVFVVSAIIWMLMPWHNWDFKKTDNEESVRDALKGQEPGYYLLPYVMDQQQFKKPEVQQLFKDGPLGYITIVPSGLPRMGPKLVMSFVYYVIVGFICAYFVTRVSGPDAAFWRTFQISGTSAFTAYGIAYFQESIWFGRPWSVTAKNLLDAFIYGLVTGAVFALFAP